MSIPSKKDWKTSSSKFPVEKNSNAIYTGDDHISEDKPSKLGLADMLYQIYQNPTNEIPPRGYTQIQSENIFEMPFSEQELKSNLKSNTLSDFKPFEKYLKKTVQDPLRYYTMEDISKDQIGKITEEISEKSKVNQVDFLLDLEEELQNKVNSLERNKAELHRLNEKLLTNDSPGTRMSHNTVSKDIITLTKKIDILKERITELVPDPINNDEEAILNITELSEHYALIELTNANPEFSLENDSKLYEETCSKHYKVISSFKRNKNG